MRPSDPHPDSARDARADRRRAELLREVNDRIREVGGGYAYPGEGLDFVCECGDEECSTHVELSPKQYDELSRNPALRVLAPGHASAA